MDSQSLYPLITIEGPTASGKSELAFALAKKLATEIISADSRQIYQFLNIGTAKPSPEERAEIKHHLIDIILPDQKYSAGDFVHDTQHLIQTISHRGKIPIVCGGTMLYIKSLLTGLAPIPPVKTTHKQVTSEFLTSHGWQAGYDYLQTVDRKFAQMINPTDKQRIQRGLEVWFAFQQPLSKFWENQCTFQAYRPFRIYLAPERQELYSRINLRLQKMVEKGLIKEIESILAMGYSGNDYGLTSVGYQEFIAMIHNQRFDQLPLCISLAAQHSRNYAKRQLTWYRKLSFDYILGEITEQAIQRVFNEVNRYRLSIQQEKII